MIGTYTPITLLKQKYYIQSLV